MLFYKVLSALLEYPSAELKAALPEIQVMLAADASIEDDERAVLGKFLRWLGESDLTELQAGYVQTFDLTPEHSLHLTHHLFGDDKGRGPALIDLTEYYKDYGLQADERELPDYLPMILEFASTLEKVEAQVFLNETVKVLTQLAANLEKAGSTYAPLLRLIESRGGLMTRLAA